MFRSSRAPVSSLRPTATGLLLATLLAGTATSQNAEVPPFQVQVDLRRLPALSQDNAGTCWSYATTSFLESELGRIHGDIVDLSELHTVYFTYLEKARHYVRLHGATQFGQGGLSHDLIHIVSRYGIVRDSDYDGLRGESQRHDHTELEAMLKAVIDQVATSRRPSERWEDAVRGILDAYLGPVPASIEVGDSSQTAREYAHRTLALPLDSYREVMSLRSEPYWRETPLLVPDNWLHDNRYWNIPLDRMMDSLDHALKAGFTAAVDLDMSERAPARRKFVWTLDGQLEKPGAVTEELRQQMFDSRETTDDHLMHIVGMARDEEDAQTYYLIKNSHGDGGPWSGHVYVSRSYLAAKMLAFMVHEDALPKDIIERFKGRG